MNAPATWYDDITVNGATYPTRHPDAGHANHSSDYLNDLPSTTRQHLLAIHEAGHAIATLAARAYLHSATITPCAESGTPTPAFGGIANGDTISCNFSDGQTFAVFLGAGERAQDHWLHQNNLWTPRRALGTELGAYGDRQIFLATNPHFGFGADRNDYRVVHDLADQVITQHWDAITVVANALATRLYLTGQQISDLAQLPNGTHSKTCTYTA